MKASELRIGNYVECYYNGVQKLYQMTPGWNIREVSEIYESKILFYEPDIATFNIIKFSSALNDNNEFTRPISITEEWLVRLGLKMGVEEYGNYVPYFLNGFNCVYFTPTGFKYSNYRPTGEIDVKYIHQLQNLFFALTGEELELKE